jgi:internalin A
MTMPRLPASLVLVGCVLGPVAPARADDAEDKAIAFVEKLGGKVTRDDKRPGKPVVAVNLYGTKMTDADLKELTALKGLTTLRLGSTKVTDAGLRELAAFKSLTELHLASTK